MILFCGGRKTCTSKGSTRMNHFGWNVLKKLIFFCTAILPEVIGRWFSRLPKRTESDAVSVQPGPSTSSSDVYCYCRGPESGEMIACDNASCPYVWFHFHCLKLQDPQRCKRWYCPDCRKFLNIKRKGNI